MALGEPIARNEGGATLRIDIDVCGVATHAGEQARVHDRPPQRRDISDQKHRKVATGQGWQVVKVAQRLVTAQGVRVVVGVALQVKQNPIGKNMVAVPRVVGLTRLVFSGSALASEQTVMLNVVGRGQLKISPKRRDN